MKVWLTGLLLVSVLWLAGCQPSAPNLDDPPQIRYGEDVCARCNMIISESRFAAAYVTPQGEVRRFDDVGGMVAHYQETGEEAAVFWVHDYETEAWLKAGDAYYVVSQDLVTPMGFGIVAYADREQADALVAAEEGAMVMEFDALLSQLQAMNLDALEGHAHEGETGMEPEHNE
jgi:copper chaperone NosL